MQWPWGRCLLQLSLRRRPELKPGHNKQDAFAKTFDASRGRRCLSSWSSSKSLPAPSSSPSSSSTSLLLGAAAVPAAEVPQGIAERHHSVVHTLSCSVAHGLVKRCSLEAGTTLFNIAPCKVLRRQAKHRSVWILASPLLIHNAQQFDLGNGLAATERLHASLWQPTASCVQVWSLLVNPGAATPTQPLASAAVPAAVCPCILR